ncbi:PREDICTED: uncharacterized protein LOC107336521 isoform X1 [Acropora digitifera]|uniref:uncharacterized protein LOC107336521 isoform X1 n=1 Tax=Acropora digitifera TaxID=70779 RepID=UPI00077A3071|nr:PREDICTED: uncharacterized protein LOC107336521 isoform X1 [Acropora digitifera]
MNKHFEVIINSSYDVRESERDLEVVVGFFRIFSSAAQLLGIPEAGAINVLCNAVLLANRKPKQPSVSDCLSEIVHKESIDFNARLQHQKYRSLSNRVSRQIAQLKMMGPDEELDDPTLWNDYIQFMGELSSRVEFPLTFKYHKGSLTRDPEVADFVTAVSIYCKAYTSFMLLLVAAKCKFKELGLVHKSNEVDRRVDCLKGEATEILSFLSEPKYLTFLGRLPCEGGKLLKILALTRRLADKHMVEAVRSSLGLEPMPDLTTVETAAEKVSRQSVKLEVDPHLLFPGEIWRRFYFFLEGIPYWIQFVNKTSFPMKVVSRHLEESGPVPRVSFHVPAHSSFPLRLSHSDKFSICGYFILYLKGDLSESNLEPPETDGIVLEFALSRRSLLDLMRWQVGKINIRHKSADEFTAGQDTHDTMQYGDIPPLYISKGDVHFMVKAEIVQSWFSRFATWRFAVQSFDPLAIDG